MADTILNGKYTLLRELGRGTFGVVWLARHELLDSEERAIKILRRRVGGAGSTLYEQAKSRFEQEAQLGAQLNRTGSARTVRVFDFEREGDDLYLVMEYLPGSSLKDRLEKGPLPIADVIRIAREVAEGLAALHALDVVHRDIKPSNILFGADGSARLGDFGLAQTRRGMSLGTLGSDSAARVQPGTPDYMSPEQSRGEARLSKASDVYTLGVVLFECLTGKLYPYIKPGTDARSLRAECPAWLAQMTGRMLKAEAGERPFDGRAILDGVQVHQPTASHLSKRTGVGIGIVTLIAGLAVFGLVPRLSPMTPNSVPATQSASPTPPAEIIGVATSATPDPPTSTKAAEPTSTPMPPTPTKTAEPSATQTAFPTVAPTPTQAPTATRLAAPVPTSAPTAVRAAPSVPTLQPTVPATSSAPVPTRLKLFADFNVQAKGAWQTSQVTALAGERVTIDYARGDWSRSKGTAPYDQGLGNGTICAQVAAAGQCAEPMPSVRTGALIGRINGQVFYIGQKTDFVMQSGGSIEFRMNEGDGALSDNDGSVTVRIVVYAP